jgi:hypothetical protein
LFIILGLDVTVFEKEIPPMPDPSPDPSPTKKVPDITPLPDEGEEDDEEEDDEEDDDDDDEEEDDEEDDDDDDEEEDDEEDDDDYINDEYDDDEEEDDEEDDDDNKKEEDDDEYIDVEDDEKEYPLYDPRRDPNSPEYDERFDPNHPDYSPYGDPSHPLYDPTYIPPYKKDFKKECRNSSLATSSIIKKPNFVFYTTNNEATHLTAAQRQYFRNIAGIVTFVADGIAKVRGLDGAGFGEMVFFPQISGLHGVVSNLNKGSVDILILGSDIYVSEGHVVVGCGYSVRIPVSKNLLGLVVDALARPLKKVDVTNKITVNSDIVGTADINVKAP